MAKKDLLKTQMTRPAIKRTRVADDDKMNEAVKQVTNGQSSPPAADPGSKKTAASEKEAAATSAPIQATDQSATAKSAAKQGTPPRKQTTKKENSVPTASTEQTRTATKVAAPQTEASTSTDEDKEPVKRMTIDLPQSLHRRLKMVSLQEDVFMKDYIIALIEKSLSK